VAQWSRADRTLLAKVVYYGPAFGGKTTNLEALHRITDPSGTQPLLSVKTAEDRTLFFDLLPFELGEILGYKVQLKLYTVPGQVHYDATRRVVLSGADAVVFVADSTADRVGDNRASLDNLRTNLRRNGIDPASSTVIVQFNKQDVADALPPEGMETLLGLPTGSGIPAVAVRGDGVLETFLAATRAMIERLATMAPERTRSEIRTTDLSAQIERVFEPLRARGRAAGDVPALPATGDTDASDTIVLAAGDDTRPAVEAAVQLGERWSFERSRARRLEREAQALRQHSEMLRRTTMRFDRDTIVARSLEIVAEVAGAAVVSLLDSGSNGGAVRELRVLGRARDPLASGARGRLLLDRMISRAGPCVVEDLAAELGGAADAPLAGLRAAASVPVDSARGIALVAYAPEPDGRFAEPDVRFLATVAAHLAIGLEKATLYEELESHRGRLAAKVEERTRELRQAYDEMRGLERTKDRFLSNVSHEMRTPITAVLTAATFLRDYDGDREARVEMAETILAACDRLRAHLDDVFRSVSAASDDVALTVAECDPMALAVEAVQIAGFADVEVAVEPGADILRADLPRLARAVANLIDNARKFSPADSPVELSIAPASSAGDGVAVEVRDRGPGIPERDRERVFEPFEQGGDVLNGKPAGVGLGLHEARDVARKHGGDLVWLPRPGGGSVFRLTVPSGGVEVAPRRETAGA